MRGNQRIKEQRNKRIKTIEKRR
jgi:hypothetical protein